jgi:mono/diheme cytochrome c family protein
MVDWVGLIAVLVAAGVLAWCTARAWRMRNRVVKWAGKGLMACLALLVSAAGVLAVIGIARLYARAAPMPNISITATPAQVRRGQAIADSFCGGCHAADGPLSGGLELAGHLPLPIGSFVSSNLTPAGPLSRWSDDDIFRAIRNGVDRDGHWLIIMSWTHAGRLSDDDIKAVIAYLRSLSPAGTETRTPPDRLSLLGTVMLGAGLLPAGSPIFTGSIAAPPKGRTVQYGEYVLSWQDCRVCHGANLTGGVKGQLPPIGPDLDLVKAWSAEQFIETMRTGVDPGGHVIGAEMPWRQIGKLDDDELGAVYEYLAHRQGPQSVSSN